MSAVSLAPEVIFNIGNIKVTNTFLATIAIDLILVSFIVLVRRNLKPIPGKIQTIAESAVDYFYTTTEQIAGKFADPIYPWFASFFIFIFVTNLVGLFPGFGSIGFFHLEQGKEVFTPILRAGTSDFNTTLALATVSLVATHYLSIKYNGVGNYLKRFFSLNPVLLFVGILELVSEVTKVISLSFRLFGNIYAGEVVIHTINSIFAYIAPIPFLLLESIVAFVQALVFAMLTMVFMSILISPHEEGGGH
ncbi:MAG TPA: F0F1 ATP synthase subunit A [Patescibacteria group bacterium]|nr:F0F1 ATP synthase subunit A [Patescibacteria group bacterium]